LEDNIEVYYKNDIPPMLDKWALS